MLAGECAQSEKASLSFMLENDYFCGHDENYTNGAYLSYMSGVEDPARMNFFGRFLGALAGGEGSCAGWRSFMQIEGAAKQQWGVRLVQLMFTPQSSLEARYPLYNEHPYGAMLAFGFAGVVKTEDVCNTFDVYLGMVGPVALGHQTQDLVHDILDSEHWYGWSNQLNNEPVILLSSERKYRLRFLEGRYGGSFTSDGFLAGSVDLGNVYIRGSSYVFYRFGYNLPAHITSISWEPSTYSIAPFAGMKEPVGNWSFYVMSGLRGRISAWDIFLDGNMMSNSKVTVTKYPFVGEFFVGFCTRYKDLDVSLGLVRRTKEYHLQREPQWMGSITARWSF